VREIVERARRLAELAERLYAWYVPPFSVERRQLSEEELQRVIADLKRRGGMRGWLRLDGTYYATDLTTLKKIIDWDWTDTRKYVNEIFDCDKFAIYFKARVSLDFGINAVGVVLDYSAGHAYNLVILKEPDGRVQWYLFEPQRDALFSYDERDMEMYAMRDYYLLL
jgi:hypothetical protein